jgi:hypothetical protein
MSIGSKAIWLLVSCMSLPCIHAADVQPTETKSDAEANDKQFHPLLLAIAKGYEKNFRRLDDRVRFAPTRCAVPPEGTQEHNTFISDSKDESTHGMKLYLLYAKDVNRYLKREPARTIVGTIEEAKSAKQVLVKEAWTAEKAEGNKAKAGDNPHNLEPAEKDGTKYFAGKRAPLFIMAQLEKDTPGSDEGWVYGTVSPDGTTVTSSGRVQSCMNCHVKEPDRLFGLPKK